MRGLLRRGAALALVLASSLTLGGGVLGGGALVSGCGPGCTEDAVFAGLVLKVVDASTGEELCEYSAWLEEEGQQGGVVCDSCPCVGEVMFGGGERFTLVVSASGYLNETRHVEVKVDRCDKPHPVDLTVALTPR
ncbi:MAG: hypothetical protein KIT72_04415 [Polyangiaceae bacterium]|nr:hypothetical protein [Polyangiaceae bacterium]MCW5789647.1 hypothetical protein [Polyangiaceae bacterium]